MKFTLSWLKTHLETDATLDQITDTLTRIGGSCDSIVRIWPGEVWVRSTEGALLPGRGGR